MFKVKKFLAVVALFFFVISCGGGGGSSGGGNGSGSGGSTPSEPTQPASQKSITDESGRVSFLTSDGQALTFLIEDANSGLVLSNITVSFQETQNNGFYVYVEDQSKKYLPTIYQDSLSNQLQSSVSSLKVQSLNPIETGIKLVIAAGEAIVDLADGVIWIKHIVNDPNTIGITPNIRCITVLQAANLMYYTQKDEAIDLLLAVGEAIFPGELPPGSLGLAQQITKDAVGLLTEENYANKVAAWLKRSGVVATTSLNEMVAVDLKGTSLWSSIIRNVQEDYVFYPATTKYCGENAPPIPPINVKAIPVSSNQIDLSWDDTPNENVYIIEFSTDGITFQKAGSVLNDYSKFSHKFLSPNTTYYYRIFTMNSKGLSTTYSETKATTIPAQNQNPVISSLIATPSSVNTGGISSVTCNASDPDGNSLTYNWTKTGGSISGSGSTVTWTAPSTAGTYTVTCSVSDGKGGTASKGVNINVTSSVSLPTAPGSLSATALSSNIIALVWQDNSNNETGFKIERRTGTTGTFTQIATVGAISGSGSGGYYENTGLSAGTTYCYRIKAYNSAGDSSYSNESCATTNAQPCATPTATTSTATNVTSNSATLSATVNPNGVSTGAFLQYGTSTSYSSTTSNQVIGSGTSNVNVSANLTGLLPNTTYNYRIVATNSCGGTVFGANQSFTTPPVGCTLPGNFTLNANAYCNSTAPVAPAVRLTWTASSGTNSYDVYRNGTLYYSSIIGTNFDNNANVTAGQTYTYYVVAKNSCGNTYSNTVTVTVPSNICSSTQTERITNGSFSSGTSGWTLWGDFWAGTNLTYYRTSPGYAAGGVDSNGYAKINALGYMYQTVTIPSNATSATLIFWYDISSQETGSTAYDVLNVTIQNSTGGYLATVTVLSNINKGTLGVYSQKTFDVTPYKGQTIRMNFLATTDGSNTTIFRIDDVSLMADGN